MTKPSKTCASCGRRFEWRRRWKANWNEVRYCSKSCRQRGVSKTDRRLEAAILELLDERAGGATICPSEAARLVAHTGWRELMEPTRRAARRLAAAGTLVILQQGRLVDPSGARGPIRLRLRRSGKAMADQSGRP
jgi:hypothetical protein